MQEGAKAISALHRQEQSPAAGSRPVWRKNVETHVVFYVNNLVVRRIREADLPVVLQIYRQCEDFLAFGPVPAASMEMVQADIAHSVVENGIYCLIIDVLPHFRF